MLLVWSHLRSLGRCYAALHHADAVACHTAVARFQRTCPAAVAIHQALAQLLEMIMLT